MTDSRSSSAHSFGMLLARFLIVFGLLPNGMRKLADFSAMAAGIGGDPQIINGRVFPELEPLFFFPFPEFFLACSVTFDLLGALLIIVGLRARTVAGVLFAYCIFAVSMYHSDFANPENVKHVIRTGPLFGGLLYIALVGAGGWSLDAWLERRRHGGAMRTAAAGSHA